MQSRVSLGRQGCRGEGYQPTRSHELRWEISLAFVATCAPSRAATGVKLAADPPISASHRSPSYAHRDATPRSPPGCDELLDRADVSSLYGAPDNDARRDNSVGCPLRGRIPALTL